MLNAQKYLEIVRSRGERKLHLERVYRLICKRDLFLAAYGKVYANKGATTPGIDPNDTVDAMSLKRIEAIITDLKAGTYKWQPVRRTQIAKKGKVNQSRPLGLPGWNDKLVQEVIRMVLEAYYEPQFSDNSHGFRSGRGCHTALEAIRTNWTGTTWFIEGDIRGCFNEISHTVLLDIIKRDIRDQRFWKLLKGMLKAGYLEEWTYHKTYSGVPQGGICSPIMSNIFLNELDHFVENELIPEYTKGCIRARNPEYRQLSKRMRKAKKAGDIDAYKRLQKKRRQIPSKHPHDPNYRRLKYCRYADDWLLGFTGPKTEAMEIKERIKQFLQSIELTMSEDKTLITHAVEDRARFLGYEVHVARNNNRITQYQPTGLAKRKARSANGRIMLSVPREVTSQYKRRCSQNGKPQQRTALLNNSDYEIVMTYNMEFQGLVNYYILAQNVAKRLYPARYAYLQSLVKTLAAKHKKNISWVYRNFYHRLDNGKKAIKVTIPREQPKAPLITTFGAKPIRYAKRIAITDEKPRSFPLQAEIVQRLLADKCELCASTEQIEVHHIRKLADIKKKYRGRPHPPRWAVFMMQRNRKTVVVCRKCHEQIHSGTYDGIKLT